MQDARRVNATAVGANNDKSEMGKEEEELEGNTSTGPSLAFRPWLRLVNTG